ncbi:MAG: UDP-glucose 4-epimerase GalE [Flavobacteriales bacterium]|nr:UDP-glucose 4-epimerase GalE [Flavobacteriales bacterium]
MKKVLVTGGAGYIGSHTVVELARSGFEPIIVDDLRNSHERVFKGLEHILGRKVEVHRVDCTDPAAMGRVFAQVKDLSGVVHFAAYKAVGESVAEPLKYYRNNVGSLLVLLELMAEYEVKHIVFSSSCTVYGQPEELPVSEEAPDRRASSPYGSTKMCCEQLLRDAHVADPSLAVVLLRYFNPIGAHPSARIGELPIGVPNNLVPFITQTASGIRRSLTVFGNDHDTHDGSCVRDFIHVVDLAEAHVKALTWCESREVPTCEVFNLGTGRGHSVLEVVRTFEEVTGRELPYTIGPRRAGDVASVYADPGKAERVLGWKAKLDLGTALRDAWAWERTLRE